MMSLEKVIVISIRPEHSLNTLNGSKTLELRKSIPKGFVGWVYGYVTKGKPYLINKDILSEFYELRDKYLVAYLDEDLNATIPFRFWFDEYIGYKYYEDDDTYFAKRPQDFVYHAEEVLKRLCLSRDEFKTYGNGKDLYAWHIKKLEVFDKPMQLSEFYRDYEVLSHDKYGNEIYSNDTPYFQLKRGPQSWQYAYISGEKQ